ncbi:MAG: amino acid permease [Crenarchaeota archaeon]|nr:MAG: amino acid permease [Thermoproteota archaeon]RDJ34592.1 MAG: amino acid permease [Thermoproteota archaeon]RDJ35887.1 MAG: amino acid permease [Thermoproteota archaeon]RDJ38464.1 MAG: amino acid permease [Thermoproteota archaeon]
MSELSRNMGLFHLIMYGVGLILGAGIYVLIGEAAGLAGNAVWISFLIGSIVAVFAGLSYAELAALFPKAAAEYVFVKNAFRNNFIAFTIGWLTSITSMITAATVGLGFGGYLVGFVDIPIVIGAIVILGILSVISFVGIRESSWMNTIFAIITIAGLVLIIILGFSYEVKEPVDYLQTTGISGIVLAFVLIFFAFIGFEDMANIAEEVKRPAKNLPRGILLAVLITGVIYILVSISVLRVMTWEELGQSSAPLADVANRAFGDNGSLTLSAIALFATASTILITLVAGARMLYGMARDGSLPKIFGKIHPKTKTPWMAVIAIFVISTGFTLIGDIVIVANIVVFAIVITFAMINLAVIVLRYTKPDEPRPFRVPINIGRFPVLPLFGLAATLYMITQFDLQVILSGVGIVALGTIVYFAYIKRLEKIHSESK